MEQLQMLVQRFQLGRHPSGIEQPELRGIERGEGRGGRSFPDVRFEQAGARYQLIDEWSSREMIAIMTGQHHNGLIPVPLPRGTVIAHKTGELHDTLNDVGIVYLDSEPYAIAVMATNLPTLDAGYRFIRGVSRLAYNELVRFGEVCVGILRAVP